MHLQIGSALIDRTSYFDNPVSFLNRHAANSGQNMHFVSSALVDNGINDVVIGTTALMSLV